MKQDKPSSHLHNNQAYAKYVQMRRRMGEIPQISDQFIQLNQDEVRLEEYVKSRVIHSSNQTNFMHVKNAFSTKSQAGYQ